MKHLAFPSEMVLTFFLGLWMTFQLSSVLFNCKWNIPNLNLLKFTGDCNDPKFETSTSIVYCIET